MTYQVSSTVAFLPRRLTTLCAVGAAIFLGASASGCTKLDDCSTSTASDELRLLTVMNSARMWHTATPLNDGRVLVVGGLNGRESPVSAVEAFEAESETWAPLTPLPIGTYFHTATLLDNGEVLVVGGYSDSGDAVASAFRYLPATDEWLAEEPAPEALAEHTATHFTLDGEEHVLFAGGGAKAFLYSPGASPVWSELPDLNTARYGHQALWLEAEGVIVVAGGSESPSNEDVAPAVCDAEVWSLSDSVWTTTEPMIAQHVAHSHTASRVPSDPQGAGLGVMIAGAASGACGETEPTAAERLSYDAEADIYEWSPVPGAAWPHRFHAAVHQSEDPQVVLIGGFSTVADNSRTLGIIDEDGALQWQNRPRLLQIARYAHTATTIERGILVTGGAQGLGGVLDSSELLSISANGESCDEGAECLSGYCVDGVCCNSACGGSCERCDLTDTVGSCEPLPAEEVCRAAAHACDPEEYCTGDGGECPADVPHDDSLSGCESCNPEVTCCTDGGCGAGDADAGADAGAPESPVSDDAGTASNPPMQPTNSTPSSSGTQCPTEEAEPEESADSPSTPSEPERRSSGRGLRTPFDCSALPSRTPGGSGASIAWLAGLLGLTLFRRRKTSLLSRVLVALGLAGVSSGCSCEVSAEAEGSLGFGIDASVPPSFNPPNMSGNNAGSGNVPDESDSGRGFCGDGVVDRLGADGVQGTADDELCDDGGPSENCSASCTFTDALRACLDSTEDQVNAVWARLADFPAPTPRFLHATALLDQGLLLFGGGDLLSSGTDETWLFEPGSGWQELLPDRAPKARGGHRMVTWGDGAALFGGAAGSPMSDLWTYSGETWERTCGDEACSPGPSGRSEHSVLLRGREAVLFGGRDDFGLFNDLWVLGEDKQWHAECVPEQSERLLESADGGVQSDAGAGDAAASTNLTDSECTAPSPRALHAMAVLPTAGAEQDPLVLFGGDSGRALGDTWIWGDDGWQQFAPEQSPSARMGHVMVATREGKLLLHGGVSGTTAFDDLWLFDPVDATWTPIRPSGEGPAGRGFHTLTELDSGELLLFGGRGSTTFGDTWLLSFQHRSDDEICASATAGDAGVPIPSDASVSDAAVSDDAAARGDGGVLSSTDAAVSEPSDAGDASLPESDAAQ